MHCSRSLPDWALDDAFDPVPVHDGFEYYVLRGGFAASAPPLHGKLIRLRVSSIPDTILDCFTDTCPLRSVIHLYNPYACLKRKQAAVSAPDPKKTEEGASSVEETAEADDAGWSDDEPSEGAAGPDGGATAADAGAEGGEADPAESSTPAAAADPTNASTAARLEMELFHKARLLTEKPKSHSRMGCDPFHVIARLHQPPPL
eukprot:gene3322-biopygen23206